MTQATWTRPEFREVNLSAEIGGYFEDGDLPADDAPPFVDRCAEGSREAAPVPVRSANAASGA